MVHVFDGPNFRQLVSEAEQLLASAIDHERQLVSQVTGTDERAADELPLASPAGPPHDLTETLRKLCVAARHQRQLAEAIVARLLGSLEGDREHAGPPGVLVVDDSLDIREMVAAVLEAAGFQVITACNGLEALLVAHYVRPAVVVMDVTMPVLDGLESARLLKASESTKHLNLIAYTGQADLFEESTMRLFADVLPKPATPAAIVESVRRCASPRATTIIADARPDA